MLKRSLRATALFALLSIGDAPVCVAQVADVPPVELRADPTIRLAALVRDAVPRNLTIDAARFTPEILAAEIQAARGAFDARLQLQPAFGRSSQTIVTPDGSFVSSIATTTVNGGAGGLLPYGAVAVVGNLPTGTRYGLSLQSARQSRSPLSEEGHPVRFDSTMTLSMSQPLLRGAGSAIARAGIRSATLDAASSRAGFARVIDTTVADVENAWWTAVYARALERVVDESLARARTLLDRNEQLLQLQLVANVDVLTARQGVAARMAALIDARQQRADASDAVLFLVYGREATAHLADAMDLDVALPDSVAMLPDEAEAQADGLRARADLREAEFRVDRSNVDVEVARDGLRPSLNVEGSYTALTSGVSTLRPFGANRPGDVATTGWQGGVNLTVPVGNNVAKAGLQQATLARRQQEAAVAAVENQIRQEVRQALRAIQMGGDRVRQATEALRLAIEEFEAENQRLQLGLSDSFRVLQFEEEISQAQQAQLDARISLALATVSFDLARGASAAKYGVALPSVPPRATPAVR
jgi:outer membrane protein TolC